jgi:hypothetical protein
MMQRIKEFSLAYPINIFLTLVSVAPCLCGFPLSLSAVAVLVLLA